MNTGKFVGSTMILIGSLIGAGMLAFPAGSAAAGFGWTALLMVVIWLASTISGLLILEVNLALPIHACTFSSMAKQTLGSFGKALTWMSYLFLLYAIITAYVIGASNVIASNVGPLLHIDIPTWLSSALFTIIFGTVVFWSTQATDYFNRILISLKGIFLFATLIFIVPYVEGNKLAASQSISQIKYVWLAAPAFLSAFAYQFVIPSIRMYIGDKPKQLKMIIIAGTSITLLIYLWWQTAALGTIPLTGDYGFINIIHDPKSPNLLIQAISFIVHSKLVTASIQGFANIALTSSFLCIALGLFDFLADGFRRPNTRLGRLQTSFLAFTPPLMFAVFFPEGFNKAITFASIAVATLVLILPALMVYNLRKNKEIKSPYKVKCGNIVIATIFLMGIASVVVAVMYILNLLPCLK